VGYCVRPFLSCINCAEPLFNSGQEEYEASFFAAVTPRFNASNMLSLAAFTTHVILKVSCYPYRIRT
jgi:hypothetical protein